MSTVRKNKPKPSKECPYCQKKFSKSEHLSRHERSHTKEKPYLCQICNKAYGRSDSLIRHKRTHNKDKTGGGIRPTSSSSQQIPPTPSDLDTSPLDFPPTPSFHNGTQNNNSYHAPQPDYHQLQFGEQNAFSMIDPGLANAHEHFSGSNGFHGESDQFIDPELEQYSAFNDGANSFSFASEHVPPWYMAEEYGVAPFAPMALNESIHLQRVEQLWHSGGAGTSEAANGTSATNTTPSLVSESSSGTKVDEKFREDLAQRLSQTPGSNDPLPSVQFMNVTLQLFFTMFNQLFPMLHEPTFKPNKHNGLLILSMCAIGSSTGTEATRSQGFKIMEKIKKSIASCLEDLKSKDESEKFSIVQAAMLGQMFAYLSGSTEYTSKIEISHGTIIAAAKNAGLFDKDQTKSITIDDLSSPEKIEEDWVEWAATEEGLRTSLGLYIQDAQFATSFYHDPTLRHSSIRLPLPADDKLFFASNATEWATLMRSANATERKQLSSYLHANQEEHNPMEPIVQELACKGNAITAYTILQGISAEIVEHPASRSIPLGDLSKFEDALMCWYFTFGTDKEFLADDHLHLMILFHEVFMSLFVSFNLLEVAIGRDGAVGEVEAAQQYARNWSTSIEAQRCVMHGSMIYRHAAALAMDSEPAVHVPKAMFHSALAWYCYVHYDPSISNPHIFSKDNPNVPETRLWDVNPPQLKYGGGDGTKGKRKLSETVTLCGMTDLLSRIGRWEVSRKYSKILSFLISGGEDSEREDLFSHA